jgi:hypothetical protein
MKLPDTIRKVYSNTQIVHKSKKKMSLNDLMLYQREKLIKDTEFINTISPQLNIGMFFLILGSFFIIYLQKKKYTKNYYEIFYTYLLDLEKNVK